MKKLKKIEAFNAMSKFIEIYFHKNKSNDFGTLLSDMLYGQEGYTLDPSAWKNWIACIDTILKNGEELTVLQAYDAMRKFLEIYYVETTYSEDVGTLLCGMTFLSDGTTVEPAAWQNWISCVNVTLEK